MKLRQVVVLVAAFALALPLAAQMGMGMNPRVPNLSGIWHPVIGSGAAYEMTGRPGRKTTMELTIVGKEDVEAKTAYWMESSMANSKSGGEMYAKFLMVAGDTGIVASKIIMQMPGQDPMEMDSSAMNTSGHPAPQPQPSDFRDKAELVGTESITVPAGTFSCEHYRMKDGSGDAWISNKVSPWGLVKMQGKDSSVVLTKVITDAKDHITGTPTKFDPTQMMRNRMGQQAQ
jgi:hypothetical protein